MRIGHINLAESFTGAGNHFVGLIESLQRRPVQQYVLVRNLALAKRLDLIDGLTVGPIVRSPVTAYCLMPEVDVVHIHDRSGLPAGLLLTLTKSVPFVLTRHTSVMKSRNPLHQSAHNRASGFIDEDQVDIEVHLRIYRHAVNPPETPMPAPPGN